MGSLDISGVSAVSGAQGTASIDASATQAEDAHYALDGAKRVERYYQQQMVLLLAIAGCLVVTRLDKYCRSVEEQYVRE